MTDVSQRMGCFRNDAEELILRHLYEFLCENLVEGKTISIFPLGKFYLYKSRRPKRDGTRNMVVKFKASRTMLNLINKKILEKKLEEGYLSQGSAEDLLPAQVEVLKPKD